MRSDERHCGACDRACAGPLVCDASRCGCAPPPLGTELRLTTTADFENNVYLASSGTNVGVLWNAGGPVYFELLALDGTPISGTRRRLDVRGTHETAPDILWNGSEYVVLYMDYSDAGARALTLQRIAPDGSLSGSAVDISAASAFPTTWQGQLDLAYSPVSGYAVVSERGFQYLGPTGTTPAAEYRILGVNDAAIAADASGRWGVMIAGDNEFYVFNADGSLTRPTVFVSLPYIGVSRVISLVHDGTTWALAYAEYDGRGRDQIKIRRGDALDRVHVAHQQPSAGGVLGITRTHMDLSGTTLLLSFAVRGAPNATMSALRLRLAGAPTDAPTVLTWPFPVVSTPTVYDDQGIEMIAAGPTRLVGAWIDARWFGGEAYAVSLPIDACP